MLLRGLTYYHMMPVKNKTLNNKKTCKIKFRRNLFNRMPIGTRGLVQLSFIHNLI